MYVTPDWDNPKRKAGWVTSASAVVEQLGRYYEWLFGPKPSDPEAASVMYEALERRKLTKGMRNALEKPVEEREMRRAIRNMALGKSPGPDKLGAEFYKDFEDLVVGDMLEMHAEAINPFQRGVSSS